MPWHILAPGAVACDILHLRARAPPPEGFYNIRNEVSYAIKKRRVSYLLRPDGMNSKRFSYFTRWQSHNPYAKDGSMATVDTAVI
ncbi:hypothetical protein CLOHYLEM_06151 [[Clostridium] hylemonae DSM 15053]|uniref:Uncharacterized protein n=1 Tax=[Clostridium] hylemonae DSM 15053 TaxID=553973 RepID=C0C1Y0_9FIRM|nr:hypothetical protein CLOHYLEM_06151 [[Clostridium] hylemonae DSM 15053]